MKRCESCWAADGSERRPEHIRGGHGRFVVVCRNQNRSGRVREVCQACSAYGDQERPYERFLNVLEGMQWPGFIERFDMTAVQVTLPTWEGWT